MEAAVENKDVTSLNRTEETGSSVARLQAAELAETQHYQLVLPNQYEQLRGYIQNDGLLADEEITRCLYDESLRRKDLARRIKERTPTANQEDRKQLTEYLWDVHKSVKGLPLSFVDPTASYRVTVVDTPTPPVNQADAMTSPEQFQSDKTRDQLSPVTLHLDIDGGFLANFLHNAQLNHEQMNRFITDLEKQHRELKDQLASTNSLPVQSATSSPGQRAQTGTPSMAKLTPTIPQREPIQSTSQPDSVADVSPAFIPQPSANHQTQSIPMSETSTTGAEAVVSGRPTRYQWAEVASQFDKVGISRQELEKAGHLDDLLNGRKTGLMKLTQQSDGDKPFQISGKLYIVNTPDKGPIIGIQPERKQLLVPNEFLGYTLTNRDKQNLDKNGEMGKRVELTDKMSGKLFAGYIGVDKDTKSLTVLRAERLHIPQTVKGVTLTKPQQKNLEQGRAVKLDGMTGNNGQTFNAYVQVSAAKRSLTFAKIPDNAIKQTVDQKTAQDLKQPVQQLKGDGAGGKKTIQPKDEVKQAAAQRIDIPASKPTKQQKPAAPKPTSEEAKPPKSKKQKGPRVA